MRFYVPNIKDENPILSIGEYARRTELITRMMLAGWLTDREIEEYISGIIDARQPYGDLGMYFWSVDDIDNMPSDSRYEYAYKPTYNIIAFMVKAYFANPQYLEDIPDFSDTLKGAMNAASSRTMSEELYQFFEDAGVYQFLCYNDNFCNKLKEQMDYYRQLTDSKA